MPSSEAIIAHARQEPIRYAPQTVVSSCPMREDVILWRALFHLQNGFYVDVGAGDPNSGSPTRWFYANGWTGVNIEPNPLMFPILSQWRPNDINLNLGVSNIIDSLTYYNVKENELRQGWGLSSFDPNSAEEAKKLGYRIEEMEVKTISLDKIYSDYCSDRDIDLLKIDVEGYEKAVIASSQWNIKRPKVVCVESTKPMTVEPTHMNWESHLIVADYVFVLFDGSNSYYVRKESPEIISQFNSGVNAGDKWRDAVTSDYKEPWI